MNCLAPGTFGLPSGAGRSAAATFGTGWEPNLRTQFSARLSALKNRWLGRVAARVALERPAWGFEAFEGFEAGQTASLNALKNRWLGRVAARVALERSAGGFEAFEGFEAGQTAGLNTLKNRWLGRVAARVALERPAGGFEAFEGFEAGQTARLNWTPLKTDGWGV